MWMCVSVLQEAVSTGDPELVQLVLQYRDFKRATERLAGIPELLSKLRQVKLVHLLLKPPGLISNRCLCHTTNLSKHLLKGLFLWTPNVSFTFMSRLEVSNVTELGGTNVEHGRNLFGFPRNASLLSSRRGTSTWR